MPRSSSGRSAAPRDGTQRDPVNPDDAARLSDALARLSLGPRAAARRWGLDVRLVQRWLAGSKAVPPPVWEMIDRELGR